MYATTDCCDTGGIIALGLATLPEEKARNIRDLKQTFFQLASKAFEKKRGQLGWTSGMLMLLRIQDSVYPTSPLRLGLQRLFGDRNLFSSHQRNVRVAVTSAKDHGADRCLIANYNRPFHSDQVHDFEREDEVVKDMNLWEAALATASAPFYFRPFEKTETGKNYVDGALHANFPVPYALDEVYRIWKTPGDEAWKKPSLDVLLSVGTGQQEREIVIPVPLRIGGFEAICTTFFNNLDSHRQWLEFQRVHLDGGANLARKVHRLNARLEEPYVSLDNYQSMERIDRGIQADFKSGKFSSQMKELAGTLIASLFFFEPSANYLNQKGIVPGLADSIPGTIRCRLARGSHPLKHLVDKISSFAYKEIRNDAELADDNGWKHITFPDQQRFEVRSENKWLRVKIVISPLDPVKSRQVVAVTLKGASQRFPISGFPLEWHVLQARSLAK